MDANSNRIDVLGGGIDASLLDMVNFIPAAAGGGATGLRVPFAASAPTGTVLARLVDPRQPKAGWLWYSGSGQAPPFDMPDVPPQLAFVNDAAGLRIQRGAATAVPGTIYPVTLIVIGKEMEDDARDPLERMWKATIPFVAT